MSAPAGSPGGVEGEPAVKRVREERAGGEQPLGSRTGGTEGPSGEPAFDHGRQGDPDGRLRDADPHAVARGIVLRQLTMAARSRAQLQAKLDAKQVPADVSRSVLDRMEEVGLVDDAAFADGWVRSRRSTRGLSRRAVSRELQTKGIAPDVIEAAVEGIDPDDEREVAMDVVVRRLRVTRTLDRPARTRRLAGMLARKGYPGGLAMSVVREALDADDAEHPPDEDLHGG